MVKTYSFSDVYLTLSHPSLGQISTNGMGMGNITKSMRTDRSQIDVAADGTPVVSKIKDSTGTLEFQAQQISALHNALKRWFNYLVAAPTSEWAMIKAVLISEPTNEQDIFTGGCFLKHPDTSYEATAGMVTWSILFAEVTQNNTGSVIDFGNSFRL